MPSVLRTICITFHVVSLVLMTSPFSAAPVLAKPLPFTLSTVYSRSSDLVSRGKHLSAGPQTEEDYTTYEARSLNHTESRRTLDNILNNIDVMNNYGDKLSQSASAFRALASQSSSQGSDAAYRQNVATSLTEVYTNLHGFSTAYSGLDKGLKNYDRTNEVETLVKNCVDSTKYTMTDVYNMVVAVPGLGEMLGPVVYEVKCVVDDMLDTTEDLTDEIVNDCKPILVDLLGTTTTAACASGVQVLGLCVGL